MNGQNIKVMTIRNYYRHTFYIFNCGFSAKFQHFSLPQFCVYEDWKLPRKPKLNI
jgi:hypothetical protein